MTQFLSQMMKFPLATFVYSMEMFLKTMQGMQSIADQGIDMMVSGIAQTLGGTPGSGGDLTGDTTDGTVKNGAKTTDQTSQKEERKMLDKDLGGDDLKYVSYSILFTKPDYEAVLQTEKQEIVDYPTDGGSYGGLKIAEFFRDVSLGRKGDARPGGWPKDYAPLQPNNVWEIPSEDRKFVKFIYKVERRLPKAEADYEKRKTRALERISRSFPS